MIVAAEFQVGQVLWSMFWFFLFVLWIWLVIMVFIDIFRSPDLSGWGKAGWSILVLIVPLLGVLIYLIARGGDNPLWPKDYLTRPDEDVVPLYPKSGLHVAVVGSTLGSIMQLWSAARLESTSIDDWV